MGRVEMRRRIGAAVAVGALLLCSACGGGGGGAGDGQAGTSTSTEVTWWGWAPGKDLADQYIAAFNEEHPDITVTYREIPYAEYVNALRLGLRSDAGPDVFALQPGEITDRFGPSAADLTSRADEALGADWRTAITGDAQSQFVVDEAQTALPVQLSASGLIWYNQGLFDEAGVEVPTDAASLRAACDAFAQAGIVCMGQGAQDAWANIDFYMTLAADFAPGAFYEAVDGARPWTDPGLVQAFAEWQRLVQDGVFGEGAVGLTTYPDTSTAFVQGKSAMTLLGTWQAGFMDAESVRQSLEDGDTELPVILPAPFPDLSGDGTPPTTFGGPDYGLSISSSSDATDASWTFVQWLAASEAGQQVVADNKFLPALTDIPLPAEGLVDPAVQEPALPEVVSFMAEAQGYREIPYADVKVALGDALAALAVGQQTPEQAAQAVQAASDGVDRS
ncbi:ABC transporter substrate-binding protein [Desertihabitans aurantiacus]|uniref:ABC transporter substrate-binding protein n=1 Tax=Desertihabitans aurantiacus TaxID=2282477 RepID=UPI000DF84963|nr:extracellular solute-binding protein [Desertihabitans aurantiacus]